MPSHDYAPGRKRDWLDDESWSTRKAEDEYARDGPSIVWQEDQRVVRMINSAAEQEPIPLPAPTQCASTSRSTASPASTSSARTSRKRARRQLRPSLPPYDTQAAAGGSGSTAGSSSAPNDLEALDDLLCQAQRLYVEPPSLASRSAKAPRRSTDGPPSRYGAQHGAGVMKHEIAALQEQSINSPRKSASAKIAASIKRPQGSKAASSAYPAPSLLHTFSDESMTSSSSATDDTAVPITPSRAGRSSPTDDIRLNLSFADWEAQVHAKLPSAGPSGHQPGVRPGVSRVGIRTNNNQHPTSTPGRKLVQPFKVPMAQPTRSSPRNANKQTSRGQSSRQAAITAACKPAEQMPPPPRPVYNNAAPLPARISTGPVRMHRASPEPADAKMPSSDGLGNESFDSLDGLFEKGGDDIEALMRAMDGMAPKACT